MANRYGAKLDVGTYTGDGATLRAISLGYRPDFITVKRRIGTGISTWKIAEMPYGLSGSWGAGAESAAGIMDLLDDGFAVSSSSNANASGSVYDYFAISSTSSFTYGSYAGNGIDDTNFTDTQKIRYTPAFLYVKGNTASTSRFRTAEMTTESGSFGQATEGVNQIQAFIANGFQLGTSTNVNGSGSIFRYLALEDDYRYYYSTSFTGNGTSQSIALPWEPDFIFVKCNSATNFVGMWFSTNPTETQFVTSTTPSTTGITGYSNGILTIGSDALANENGVTVRLLCFKAGEYPPLDLNRA